MSVIVISTGLNAPTKEKCKASVARQTLHSVEDFTHVYVESDPNICALDNFHNVAHECQPDDILVSLDGDDWLSHPGVLDRVNKAYADPSVWLTYGSFVHADGRPGFASEYKTDDFRSQPWRATHLKTFRAGLFQKLTDEDLKRDGRYRDLCWDMTIMFPMLEMAGLEHSRFITDVLYVYNYANAWERSASREEREREQRMVKELRGMPRKGRLTCL